MNEKKKMQPKVRFREFTGENASDWEQRKLGEMSSFSKGSGYTKNDLTSSGTPIVLYGRLYTDYHTVIRHINTLVRLKEGSVISEGGEVIIPASGETALDIARASVVEKSGVIIGGDLNIVKVNKEIIPSFLAIMISNGSRQKELAKKAQGKSIVHIHNSDLKLIEIIYPTVNEQEKIWEFFNTLDKLITLHQRKLEQLEQLKNTLLSKMFPKSGTNIPEIRFSGFTDAWKQRQLGEFAKITTGKLDANAMVNDGDYDFYTSGIKKYKIDTYAFEGPAITIAGNGATVGYMHLADGKFNAYQRTYVLTKFLADRNFLYNSIRKNLPKKIQQESRTGNIPYIVMEMLTQLTLKLPCQKEQETIGYFFVIIDNTITIHQRKLDQLKNLKQTLLNKMFI